MSQPITDDAQLIADLNRMASVADDHAARETNLIRKGVYLANAVRLRRAAERIAALPPTDDAPSIATPPQIGTGKLVLPPQPYTTQNAAPDAVEALVKAADVAEDEDDKYLIVKRGMYYRPNSQGYTSSPAEAGRYTLAQAVFITHPNGPDRPRDGMSFVPVAALAPAIRAGGKP